jgi:glycosyltransferase involved in cell wall biosynthesis
MSIVRLLAIIEANSITGPAKNLLDFAEQGRGFGVETIVGAFVRGEGPNTFLEAAARQSISLHTIAEKSRFDSAGLRGLSVLVRQLEPDVIQTHAVKSHFLTRAAGIASSIPWVAFHHGYTWPDLRMRFYNELDRWSLRAATKVLTVSLPFRRQLLSKGVSAERIEVIHNSIRSDWGVEARTVATAERLRAKLGIPHERRVVLTVGRLSKEKNHLGLLASFKRLPPHLAAHLVIVGEGPERGAIEQFIADNDLTASVTLTGQQRSAEPYYGIADAAVLSSWSEGSPNALLEAMVAGVPVVATAVGGVPEIVEDSETALLVSPGDYGAMAGAIERVLTDHLFGKMLASRARQVAIDRFTPSARARRLATIYRDLSALRK